MADIFLSYGHDDLATARLFAEGFEREGFTVWWDATLRSGESFDSAIEAALKSAKAVVVLWSKNSVQSRWVRAEATLADRNRTLVPVIIEPCERPIMFELTHTADLSHWKGDANDRARKTYLTDVRRFFESGTPIQTAPAITRPARRIGLLVAASLAVVGVVAAGILWSTVQKQGAQPSFATSPAASATASGTAASGTPRTSVAVMPFANLTGDASKDYLGDGMAEELINVLAKVPGLTVPSRTSSFAYKGRSTDLKQIARDLGVGTILEGSVRSAGSTIRITAQLIDAQTDRHLWSATYDRQSADLFKLQDDLAREIVTAFKKTVNADLPEFESQAPPTKDAEAYSLYLQGQALVFRNSVASARDGVALLDRAIARDPEFARAYLARAVARGYYGSPLAEMELDAKRAVELDSTLGNQAQGVFADVAAKRGNWLAAEKIFRALPRNSTDPDVHASHALSVLWPTGQLHRVLDEYGEAYRLAPARAATPLIIGMAHAAVGHDAEAINYANVAISLGLDSTGRRIKQLEADIAARAGRYGEAADLMTSALSDGTPPPPGSAEVVKLVYAAMSDPTRKLAAAPALRSLLKQLAPNEWVVKVWAMGWYGTLGDLNASFEVAEQLRAHFRDQSPTNAWSWLWTPEFRFFRQDSRFQAFATRLGLMRFWLEYGPPDDCDLKNGKLTCR